MIVAVDVGGSGLRLTLGSADHAGAPDPLVGPGARIDANGMQIAPLVETARELLGRALADAKVGADDAVDALVWATRGVTVVDPMELLAAISDGLPARHTAVVADPVAALAGAVGGLRPGAVVAAGTGAIAFASDFADVWVRADGWGHLLGDRGSAASLGLQGVRAALRTFDGMPDGSPTLLAAAQGVLGPARTWPQLLTGSAAAAEQLARVAPVVAEAATAGDPVAAALCREAGEALAQSLLQVGQAVAGATLTAVGGLLAAAPVRAALEAEVHAAGRELVPARGGALDGAWRLSQHLAEQGRLPEHPAYVWQR